MKHSTRTNNLPHVIPLVVCLLLTLSLLTGFAHQTAAQLGEEAIDNKEGDIEVIYGTSYTHHFVTARGVRWHYVDAGNPANETIVFVHGLPESWYSWHHQMEQLSKDYYVIALDLKGYGQSDKNDGNYHPAAVARELVAALDSIGLQQFNLVSHEWGTLVADYVAGYNPWRILRYCRGESFLLVQEPSVREHFRSLRENQEEAVKLFSQPEYIYKIYETSTVQEIPESEIHRIAVEFSRPGTAEAVVRYFRDIDLEVMLQGEELKKRKQMFMNMAFPVLLWQADSDARQPQWYFDNWEEVFANSVNAELHWIENSGHFTELEQPEAVTNEIRNFLTTTPTRAEFFAAKYVQFREEFQATHDAIDAQFNHRDIEVNGIKWHFVDEGPSDGPVVLMVHGVPEGWYSWRYVMPLIDSEYRIIAPDCKGYGRSDKEDDNYEWHNLAREMKEFMVEGLGVDKFYVVSHDFGSAISTVMVTDYPEHISGFVRMQADIFPPSTIEDFFKLKPQWKMFQNDLLSVYLMSDVARFIDVVYDGGNYLGLPLHDRTVTPFNLTDRNYFVYEYSRERVAESVTKYYQIENWARGVGERLLQESWPYPIMVIQADKDSMQPLELFEGLKDYPHIEFKVVANASHFCNLDNPEQVADIINDFLSRHPLREDFSNVFFMSLSPGLNMISLPLEPQTPYKARSFAEMLSATTVIKLDEMRQRFVGFTLDAPDDGFTIEGGKGYIVNVPEARVVAFTGAAWTNQPPVAAPEVRDFSYPTQTDGAWAFVVSGRLQGDSMDSLKKNGYIVTIRNTRTNTVATDVVRFRYAGYSTQGSGYFAIAFADLNRKNVVKTGDILEVVVRNTAGEMASETFTYTVTAENILKALMPIILQNIEIPRQSLLLQNYPNPFNPETWIPYQIREPAEVMIRIVNANVRLVRILSLGPRTAGFYLGRTRAAYWNGHNNTGEKVASGIYFYQIKAGDFTAMRKMVIVK